MKGIEKALEFIIIIIALLIVLWVGYTLINSAKGSGEITVSMATLKQCCSDRSKWKCDTAPGVLGSVVCDVPGGKTMTLDKLADQLHVNYNNLPDYCYCKTS
jgi:hypothetical protein